MNEIPERYSQVLDVFENGGMSSTLKCHDAHLDRPVVVKYLKGGVEKYRLLDELSALSAIRSKYVVQVLDVIYSNGEITGLVEEFIDGPNLTPLQTHTERLPALKSLYPIFAGVADIHAHGRLHRDLKPDNMKFDASGNLKVFDFGLAKMSSNAKTGHLFFTKGYAAPEIFNVDETGVHSFTSAVDVFAAGAISFWLLSGGNLPINMYQIPPSLPCCDFGALGTSLAQSTIQLLNNTLSENPDNRPTAEEVRAALAKELLYDRHKLLLTYNGSANILSAEKRNVKLTVSQSSIEIFYDGYDFKVVSQTGIVRINNSTVGVGDILHGAVVIVFDTPGRYPTSVTADISHPEVIL